MTKRQIRLGATFSLYNKRVAAKGVITKVNRVNVIYDSPYFVTSTSPDGWLRGLTIKLSELQDAQYHGQAQLEAKAAVL